MNELSGWLIMLGKRLCAVTDGGAIRGPRRAAGEPLATRGAPAETCVAEAQALAIDAGRLSDTARTRRVGDPHHACRHDTSVAAQASACWLWCSMDTSLCAAADRETLRQSATGFGSLCGMRSLNACRSAGTRQAGCPSAHRAADRYEVLAASDAPRKA